MPIFFILSIFILNFASSLGCLGDVDNNGKIDAVDMIEIRDRMNKPAAGENLKYDINQDGEINLLDLAQIRKNLGKNCDIFYSPTEKQWWKGMAAILAVLIIMIAGIYLGVTGKLTNAIDYINNMFKFGS